MYIAGGLLKWIRSFLGPENFQSAKNNRSNSTRMKTVNAKKGIRHLGYFVLVAAFSLGNCLYLHAQEYKHTPKQLKAFEGKYTFQFQPGQTAYLQITAKEDHLMVKELWTGNEMKFLPTSELDFFHKERAFPLKFTKDNKGVVTHVLAFNKDLWTKEVGK